MTASTLVRMVILAIVIVWPITITTLLYLRKDQLDEKEFKNKLISAYEGIKLQGILTIMYT